jgi:hypothetical protein
MSYVRQGLAELIERDHRCVSVKSHRNPLLRWATLTKASGRIIMQSARRIAMPKKTRGLHLRLWSNLDFCQAAHQIGRCFLRVGPTRFAQPIKLHNVEAPFAQFQAADQVMLAPQSGRQLSLCQSGLAAQLRDSLAQALALTRVNGFVHAPIMRAALPCTQNANGLRSSLLGHAYAMNYFGYYGGLAPLLNWGRWTATPTDARCAWCAEPILEGEDGIEHPNGSCEHIECFIRSIVGSVIHQNHRCPCYGGSKDHDEKGIPKRAAARAAFENWQRWGVVDGDRPHTNANPHG